MNPRQQLDERHIGMKTVKVSKDKLLEAVTKNRADHRDVFLKAQEKYRTKAIQCLEQALLDAREGRRVNTFIQLEAPQDHTRDYDRIIAMLEMSEDELIELSTSEFESYVMDRWSWAGQFGANALSYGMSSKYLDIGGSNEG